MTKLPTLTTDTNTNETLMHEYIRDAVAVAETVLDEYKKSWESGTDEDRVDEHIYKFFLIRNRCANAIADYVFGKCLARCIGSLVANDHEAILAALTEEYDSVNSILDYMEDRMSFEDMDKISDDAFVDQFKENYDN